jgi:hypothetical protein
MLPAVGRLSRIESHVARLTCQFRLSLTRDRSVQSVPYTRHPRASGDPAYRARLERPAGLTKGVPERLRPAYQVPSE